MMFGIKPKTCDDYKDIVKIDNFNDSTYRKTLLSQHHNTSGGKSFKYISEMRMNFT